MLWSALYLALDLLCEECDELVRRPSSLRASMLFGPADSRIDAGARKDLKRDICEIDKRAAIRGKGTVKQSKEGWATGKCGKVLVGCAFA